MEFRAAHRALEFLPLDDLPEEGVGAEQHVVVEEDVVDAHDPLFAQHRIACLCIAAVHRQTEAEMRVVIEVRARGDDPVHESRLDERDERRHAESRRREGAGEGEADGDVGLEHLRREQLAGFAESCSVVRLEGAVDQVGGRLAPVDATRLDLPAAQELRSLVRGVWRSRLLTLLGGALLLALVPCGGGLRLAGAVARRLESAALATVVGRSALLLVARHAP